MAEETCKTKRVEIFSNLSMDPDEYMQCDKNHIIFDHPVGDSYPISELCELVQNYF